MKISHKTHEPCRPMEAMLNDLVDNRLSGWKRALLLGHIARCHGCATFCDAVRKNREKLRAAKSDASEPSDTGEPLAQLAALKRLKLKIHEASSQANLEG